MTQTCSTLCFQSVLFLDTTEVRNAHTEQNRESEMQVDMATLTYLEMKLNTQVHTYLEMKVDMAKLTNLDTKVVDKITQNLETIADTLKQLVGSLSPVKHKRLCQG